MPTSDPPAAFGDLSFEEDVLGLPASNANPPPASGSNTTAPQSNPSPANATLRSKPAASVPSAQSLPNDTTINVNRCQKGNPVLKHIHNVKWAFQDDLNVDFELGKLNGALFLSMQYHLLHPEYIDTRIRRVERHFKLRIILCSMDVENSDEVLQGLIKLAFDNEFTLLLTWSAEEAARYLETYKAYEHKPADAMKARVDPSYYAQLTEVLTTVRSVNKSDVFTLASTFGTLKRIMECSREELSLCPGLGEKKVARIWDAFHSSF